MGTAIPAVCISQSHVLMKCAHYERKRRELTEEYNSTNGWRASTESRFFHFTEKKREERF
jgi:hypothetical protein